jgi:phage shock protein A
MSSWWPWSSGAAKEQAKQETNALDSMDELERSLTTLQLRRGAALSKIKPQVDELSKKAAAAGAAGNTTLAKQLLVQKLRLEGPIKLIDGQIENLQQIIGMTESTATTVQTASAFKSSTSVIKGMLKTVNVEDIEDVQGDLAEVMTDAGQLNQALAKPLYTGAVGEEADAEEEAVAAQLAEWEAARLAAAVEKLPSVSANSKLPPTEKNDPERVSQGL